MAMNPNEGPRRWLILCIVGGIVAGAGGLLPSLLSGETSKDVSVEEPRPDGLAPRRHLEFSAATAGPSAAAMLGRLAAGTVLVLALCAGTLPLLRRWLVASPTWKP